MAQSENHATDHKGDIMCDIVLAHTCTWDAAAV